MAINYNPKVSPQCEKQLYIKDGRTVKHAVLEACGVSLTGDIENPPGCISLSPAQGDTALSGELYYMIFRGPFLPQHSVILCNHYRQLQMYICASVPGPVVLQ